MTNGLQTSALYRFATLDNLPHWRDRIHARCQTLGIRGTLLLASEGINGTVAGTQDALDELLAHLRGIVGLEALTDKRAPAPRMPFRRLKVKIKREIVTLGVPGIDPVHQAGHYVKPADWNHLLEQPGTVVVDVRNHYEVALGTFDGAVDPGTRSFTELPAWVDAQSQPGGVLHGAQRVAMFCTGGIRCEKSTALLRMRGIEEVYHLEGGILKYLEVVPPESSRWQGECFVFDERVSVVHGLSPGTAVLCRACREPLTPDDLASTLYVPGVSCPHCHARTTPDQKAAYAERHRQVRLAEARGSTHIGLRSLGEGD